MQDQSSNQKIVQALGKLKEIMGKSEAENESAQSHAEVTFVMLDKLLEVPIKKLSNIKAVLDVLVAIPFVDTQTSRDRYSRLEKDVNSAIMSFKQQIDTPISERYSWVDQLTGTWKKLVLLGLEINDLEAEMLGQARTAVNAGISLV